MVDAEVKMVVVNGVRYRPEDAPEESDKADEPEHKMREPRKTAKKSSHKS